MMDIEEIRPLVELLGPEDAWASAIEVLGYPPTWVGSPEDEGPDSDIWPVGKE